MNSDRRVVAPRIGLIEEFGSARRGGGGGGGSRARVTWGWRGAFGGAGGELVGRDGSERGWRSWEERSGVEDGSA